MKIKKGDTVVITGGKDKGKKGKVEKVFPNRDAVMVAGVNLYKRHLKRRSEKEPGGIIDLPRPLNIAKVALVCSSCGRPSKISYITSGNEKKRICRKCRQQI